MSSAATVSSASKKGQLRYASPVPVISIHHNSPRQIMNLQPIMALTEGALFRDLNDFVRDGIVDRIDEIVPRSECYPVPSAGQVLISQNPS